MSETPEKVKRFYTEVSVRSGEGGRAVLLDGRPVRSPGRRILLLPTEAIAAAAAAEWDAQATHIEPHTMPVTRLANTVIDGIADDPGAVREDLKRYAETDLLFYRADQPERLVALQAKTWDPVLRAAETRIGGLFRTGAGVMHIAQPAETLSAVSAWIDKRHDPFALAALHQATTLTGSLILAIAVHDHVLDPADAWERAHVDEDWNIAQWGDDEEAAARRRARERDFYAAALLMGRTA